MLGINVNIEVKDIVYPIYFDGINQCVHCGSKDTLELIDKFGHKTREVIHPLDHIRCSKCGRVYSIKWIRNEDTNKMHPCAVTPSIAQQFSNCIKSNSITNRENKI